MKIKSFATAAGAAVLALGVWMTPAGLRGQPMYDRLHVELPYKVTLGEKVLQPGEYTIQRLPDTGDSRILLFYTNNGLKFETSAMTIPALDQNTARDTKVILNRVGDDFYISKIWVQGKDYGYELPIPKTLKDREKEATETTVAATYQPTDSTNMQSSSTNANSATAAPTTNATNTNTPPTNNDTTTSSTVSTTTAATATEVTPPATAQNQTVPPAQSTPITSQTQPPPNTTNTAPSTTATTSTEVAQATQPSTPSTGTADRSATQAPETPAPAQMPATAANWVMMLLGGGTLSGAGMMLRRKR